MIGLREMLLKEQKHLESIVGRLCKSLDHTFPAGKLRISVDGVKTRYYHCIDDRYGSYIPKGNEELAHQLAQKTYDETVLKVAENRLKMITKCLKDYSDDEIEMVYNAMHTERQALVIPVEPTVEHLEAQWFNEPYKPKEFQEGTPLILTERGERVRSKSEKILADFFYRNNILYKYEKPLLLKGYGTVYPDFSLFSRRIRDEIYWEHDGMIDKPEYARAAVKKINSYQMNGIFPGERLILTFETEQDVLNMSVVSRLVDKYLR